MNRNAAPGQLNPGRKDTTMKRYEVKQIGMNWYGIWDNTRKEYVIESTAYGIRVYAEMFGC